MFGPLNGVRVVLVAAACLAAVVAFGIGEPWVGLILVAGVVVHGIGWLYLYRQRADQSRHGESSSDPLGESGRHHPGALP